MKRTPAGPPHEFGPPSNASAKRKDWSSADEDAATPMLVLIIACLVFAILALRTPDNVVLTVEQTPAMPIWGP
jgi:hypothetical protein